MCQQLPEGTNPTSIDILSIKVGAIASSTKALPLFLAFFPSSKKNHSVGHRVLRALFTLSSSAGDRNFTYSLSAQSVPFLPLHK